MSYILDALKRADAERERERGAVPGLQSRHMTTPAAQAAHGARNRVWLAAAATVLALGGIAAGLWLWQTPAMRLAAVEPAVARLPAAGPPAQPMPAFPSSPAPESAVAPPRIRTPLPPAAPKSATKPAPAAGTQTPSKPTTGPAAGAAESFTPTPVAPVPAPPPKATAAQPVPLLGELSENIRRQIPPLAITGAVYSKNPGQRLLLVNNQVLTQGSPAAPDLILEEIQAKSSVFSFRGTRFRVAH